jgi:hypothetical protein
MWTNARRGRERGGYFHPLDTKSLKVRCACRTILGKRRILQSRSRRNCAYHFALVVVRSKNVRKVEAKVYCIGVGVWLFLFGKDRITVYRYSKNRQIFEGGGGNKYRRRREREAPSGSFPQMFSRVNCASKELLRAVSCFCL